MQRKRIRHLYLRLDPADGSLRVSAPAGTTDRAIRRFVTSRADWIARQRSRLADRPARLGENALPETLHLLGQTHPVRFSFFFFWCTRHGRVEIRDAAVHVSSRDSLQARALMRRHCRARLQGVLEQRVPHWAERMALACPETRIRRMKTRWGSCNIRAGRIWLNLELARLPIEAIDLVIVHELAHLIERGHNRRFYSVMDSAYPDWRHWESALTAYGIIGL